MPTPQELETKFWSALKDDKTVMLGFIDSHEHFRPMTAMLDEEDKSNIWFFTAKDTSLVEGLAEHSGAMMNFTAKGHNLFACVEGTLSMDNDAATIDRLWNPHIAAWYEEGKYDPKLALLRFRPHHAEIWLNASSLLAGIKIMLGTDPKKEYKDNIAHVQMN